MTHKICKDYGLSVKGIIINNFDSEGYPADELKRDIEGLTKSKVLGVIPRLESLEADSVSKVLKSQINIQELLAH